MDLEIYWTSFSERELQNIFEYYKEKAGITIAKNLVEGIFNETQKLTKQPNIGQKEQLLEDREQEFRYLIFKNYKIVYWFNAVKNRIEINDVFDTRQNPVKMSRVKQNA